MYTMMKPVPGGNMPGVSILFLARRHRLLYGAPLGVKSYWASKITY